MCAFMLAILSMRCVAHRNRAEVGDTCLYASNFM